MKTLIIEDEKAALRDLKAVINEVSAGLEIIGETDCIVDTIEWFQTHPMPELVFMDIHLADGSAFEVFEHVEVKCPIIFTTAYDEYALRAFHVNSIAYLLKPINRNDLQNALDKLETLCGTAGGQTPPFDFMKVMHELKKEESYKTHFLVPAKGDKLIPISVNDILFFYISDGIVKAVDRHADAYIFSQSLDELVELLNPRDFFRVNRQYLIAKKAITDVSLWFNGRLVINLKVPVPEKIIVSKAKVSEFKDWF